MVIWCAGDWGGAAVVVQERLRIAEEEAARLRETVEDSEEHRAFAQKKVGAQLQSALEAAKKLRDPTIRARLEAAAGRRREQLIVPSGGEPLDMLAPEFWPSIFYNLWYFGDGVYGLPRDPLMPYAEWAAYVLVKETLLGTQQLTGVGGISRSREIQPEAGTLACLQHTMNAYTGTGSGRNNE